MKLNTSSARNIFSITLRFGSDFRRLLSQLVNVDFIFPQQFLQTFLGVRIWEDLNETAEVPYLVPETIEAIKRRNKPKEPCFLEWRKFDDIVLQQHIKKVGCRAPYMDRYKNFSLCDTKKKMQSSMFNNFGVVERYPPVCQGISNLALKKVKVPMNQTWFLDNTTNTDALMLLIGFLDKVKIITQYRLVDGQALVGYIGGYVGLFLGTI